MRDQTLSLAEGDTIWNVTGRPAELQNYKVGNSTGPLSIHTS
jgi:hypothetical protein